MIRRPRLYIVICKKNYTIRGRPRHHHTRGEAHTAPALEAQFTSPREAARDSSSQSRFTRIEYGHPFFFVLPYAAMARFLEARPGKSLTLVVSFIELSALPHICHEHGRGKSIAVWTTRTILHMDKEWMGVRRRYVLRWYRCEEVSSKSTRRLFSTLRPREIRAQAPYTLWECDWEVFYCTSARRKVSHAMRLQGS